MRTEQQISDEMDRVQSRFPELANLTSKSDTSVFGLLRNIWIALQMALDHYIDDVRAELVATAAAVRVGSLNWYVDQVKAFQYGDPIAVVNGRVGYDVPDASKRIVVQAAATESDGRLTIKVAKLSPSAIAFSPLTVQELTSLKDYVRAIKYAGVAVDLVSLPADELQITATVKYNRQLLNSAGQRLDDNNRLPAAEAIQLYIRQLPFDSVLNGTAMTDFVRNYYGVADFVIVSMGLRASGATDFVPFSREVTSRAGHMNLVQYNLTYV